MDTLFAKGAGLDVHQKSLTVAGRCRSETGKLFAEVRTSRTMTRDLRARADSLEALGGTQVALESTGVLGKPAWTILEGRFTLRLVNPAPLKQGPGRKSDVRDAEGIAQLLQCGRLRSSFVPRRERRELRDLTRSRAQLASAPTRRANRIPNALEDANIKLSAVATDIRGKSGRARRRALIRGERDPGTLAEMAKGVLRGKIPELKRAREGHFTDPHRFLVEHLRGHPDELERHEEELSRRIAERFRPWLDDARVERLDAIPGINRTTLENVVAEIGADRSVDPDEDHLSSWAGTCPGNANEESAGKRSRSRTTRTNRGLRRAPVEAAWAAGRTKQSDLGAPYRRRAARRGKKRASLAVGHTRLVILYHMLKSDVEDQDLGVEWRTLTAWNRSVCGALWSSAWRSSVTRGP